LSAHKKNKKETGLYKGKTGKKNVEVPEEWKKRPQRRALDRQGRGKNDQSKNKGKAPHSKEGQKRLQSFFRR